MDTNINGEQEAAWLEFEQALSTRSSSPNVSNHRHLGWELARQAFVAGWQARAEIKPINPRIHPNVLLLSGNYFEYLDPWNSQFTIEDIATNLSKLCRYCGGIDGYDRILSVAQHCVVVSEMCPPELAYPALLHDAAEFVLADMPGPLKNLCRDYKAIEAMIEPAVLARFGVDFPLDPRIKEADLLVMAMEQRDIRHHMVHGNRERKGPWQTLEHIEELPARRIEAMTPFEARTAFLERYEQLAPSREALPIG
jgi:uncharacterized protein